MPPTKNPNDIIGVGICQLKIEMQVQCQKDDSFEAFGMYSGQRTCHSLGNRDEFNGGLEGSRLQPPTRGYFTGHKKDKVREPTKQAGWDWKDEYESILTYAQMYSGM